MWFVLNTEILIRCYWLFFTQRCSVVERNGCFHRRLFICQFVCFVNMTTSKWLNVTWLLGALYKNLARVWVWRSKVKGQGHRAQNEKVQHFVPESSSGARSSASSTPVEKSAHALYLFYVILGVCYRYYCHCLKRTFFI